MVNQVREWTSKLRKQQYLLDRQIRNIQREEDKVKLELKKAAKRGDKDVCLMLAKEIVNSRKAVCSRHWIGPTLLSLILLTDPKNTDLQSADEFSGDEYVSTIVDIKSCQRYGEVDVSHEVNAVSDESARY